MSEQNKKNVKMIDVGTKKVTKRTAIAEAFINLSSNTKNKIGHYFNGGTVVNSTDSNIIVSNSGIYDSKKRKIFLARDRAGEKPLYYILKDKEIVLANCSALRLEKTKQIAGSKLCSCKYFVILFRTNVLLTNTRFVLKKVFILDNK